MIVASGGRLGLTVGFQPVTSRGFDRGDHIKVQRCLYSHHGIYVDDSRVVDFSGGRSIADKPGALVQARTLKEFERGGIAEKVPHPQRIFGGLGAWIEHEYTSDQVVRRAEALCQVAATKGSYRLSGSNCEHIANWCKCGAHESKQVRRVHAWHVVVGAALLVSNPRLSRLRPLVLPAGVLSTLVTGYMQLEAWTTPRRWRPIIAEAESLLREEPPGQYRAV